MGEVSLATKDGSISISGELISLEDNIYTISTIVGEMRIDASTVECFGDECPAVTYVMGETIRVAGSPVLAGAYLYDVLDEYALDLDANLLTEATPEGLQTFRLLNLDEELILSVEVTPLEPVDAFDALLSGNFDMVLSARRANNAEIEAFADAGLGEITDAASETIVAQDGLVVVVSRDNPVRSLTLQQLDGIFSGAITNWSALGGGDAAIELILPAENAAERETFYTAVLEPNFSDFATGTTQVGSVAEIANAVSRSPSAIGLTSSAFLGNARPVEVVASCGMAVQPGDFTIKSEDYPLTRRHYAYVRPDRVTGHINNVTELMTERPQTATGAGLVSLETISGDLNDAGYRLGFSLVDPSQSGELQNLRGFVSEVLNAERLSTTFRFGSGSSQLDNKARADAVRLAKLLEQPQYSGREVMLIGFTDSIGRSDVNLLLSQRRAQQVLDELANANLAVSDDKAIEVLGFGASSPIACNTEDQGRELNRRVEVWLR